MERRRINLSVTPEQYAKILEIGKKAKLGNACKTVAAMVSLICYVYENHEEMPSTQTIEDEIGIIFSGLDGYDAIPEAGHCPVRKPKRYTL